MKITTLIAGFVWPLLLSSAFGQTKYLVTRIPGNEAVPVDMNNFGQIVGNYTAGDGTSHAFLYSFGLFRDLTTTFHTPGDVVGINNREQITGSYIASDGQPHTFLQSLITKQITEVGPGTPYGMNDQGDIVGWGYQHQGFVYSNGQQSFIGPAATRPPSLYYGECINDRGQIAVGVDSEISQVYLYSGGTFTSIGSALLSNWYFTPPRQANNTVAFAINEHGEIAGISGVDWGTDGGFVYSGGSIRSLVWCVPGNCEHCLNNSGEVVGTNLGAFYGPDRGSAPNNPPPVAFLYKGGQTFDLNKAIPSNTGIVLTGALAINDAGIILANGYSTSGSVMGSAANYLLVPVPFTFGLMR
jgi:probable HAF family extracellular repeat protein